MTNWSFIADTDSYAGNFEREFAGYLTGCYLGHDSHGKEESQKFVDELGLDKYGEMCDITQHRIVDHGDCSSSEPFGIVLTPKYSKNQQKRESDYQSVAIFLRDKPDHKLIEFFTDRARKFFSKISDDKVKILGFRVVKEVITTEVTEIWKLEE